MTDKELQYHIGQLNKTYRSTEMLADYIDGRRIQISGVILMPWYFIVARRRSDEA